MVLESCHYNLRYLHNKKTHKNKKKNTQLNFLKNPLYMCVIENISLIYHRPFFK